MDTPSLKQRLRLGLNRILLRRFPPCKEVVQIISASLDRPLTLREKFVMRMHLFACRPCERYLKQSEFLQTATRDLDENLKEDVFDGRLSDAARDRIKAMLKASPAFLPLLSFIT